MTITISKELIRGSMGHVECVKSVFPKNWRGHDLTPYLKDEYKDRK